MAVSRHGVRQGLGHGVELEGHDHRVVDVRVSAVGQEDGEQPQGRLVEEGRGLLRAGGRDTAREDHGGGQGLRSMKGEVGAPERSGGETDGVDDGTDDGTDDGA